MPIWIKLLIVVIVAAIAAIVDYKAYIKK